MKTIIVKVSDEEKKTIGEAVIKAGETFTVVETVAASENSKIFVTPEIPVEIGVNSIKAGEGFKIEINTPQENDLKINWWIVNEK